MGIPDLSRLEAYQYALPESLIAQAPAEPRDSARLLVIHRDRGGARPWEHRRFLDLPGYLGPDELVIANNSRVIRARLLGHRLPPVGSSLGRGGKVELLLLEEKAPLVWECLFRASARSVPGLRMGFPAPDGRGLGAELVEGSFRSAHGTVVARFDRDPLGSGAGEIPLPPYIRRPGGEPDEAAYQTVFARHPGSAAAPTAGLHFTERVLGQIRARGANWRELTLHVGLGTFRPVKESDIRAHLMHEERYHIDPETADAVNRARVSGKKILAVGTTSVRALESALSEQGTLRAGHGRTSLFIRPEAFRFRVVDRLLTNFHLPGSTLLMLVCAFAGRDLVLSAYEEAVREGYRFFSYGDAMLIL